MRTLWSFLALSLMAAPAAAVNTQTYEIPYLGLLGSHLATDAGRGADSGIGYQVSVGVPFDDPRQALEVTLFDHAYERNLDGLKNYQTGILIDYVRDFGSHAKDAKGRSASGLRRLKPFVLAGVGFVKEDSFDEKHLHPSVEAGAGLLIPVGGRGWALRLDARATYQFNKESANGEHGTRSQNSVLDTRFMAGLQIPLTAFFDRRVKVPEAAECEIAVVDPETGRRDCVVDSDRDGVPDERDQCPATAAAMAVNAFGCPAHAGDPDADGVTEGNDRCPHTLAGLKVDAWGCASAQTLVAADISFAPESARLTPQAERRLHQVARMLLGQPQLRLEIAVHTDGVASEAYNLMLSQRRAEAIRDFLRERGVPDRQLQAVGYGKSQPLADNDTQEGRIRNRRVELRFWD